MTVSRKLLVVLLLCTGFPAFSGQSPRFLSIIQHRHTEYIAVAEMTKKFEAGISDDLIARRFRIYYKNHTAVFAESHCLAILDGSLYKSSVPAERLPDGRMIIPLDMAMAMLHSFFPEYEFSVSKNLLIFDKKAVVQETPPEKQEADSVRESMHTGDRISFIIIDAGHGGKDPGALGRGGIREKDITLAISKYLQKELKNKIEGVSVIMSRNSDRFIELSRRAEIANRRLSRGQNGIFISIHVNASLSEKISGFETYFLSQNPSNEDARNTAALENNVVVLEESSGKKKYDDVDYIEAMMLTTQIQKESSMLAETVQKEVADMPGIKSRGVKKADFLVLRGALMPAILVEAGFITNRQEALKLVREDYQKKVAKGIAAGVISFIDKYNRLIK